MDKPIEIVGCSKTKTKKQIMHNIYRASSAAKAWASLSDKQPQKIETMKKNSVFRLKNVGQGSSDVIAKRLYKAIAGSLPIELIIYEKILPQLSMPILHYYGYVHESSDDYWLFMEYADGEKFSPFIKQHRVLAAEWLGIMHTSAQRFSRTVGIPDYGPDYYLSTINSTLSIIAKTSNNPILKVGAKSGLRNIVSQLNYLAAQWDKIKKICTQMPRTLVHGDLMSDNLSVRVAQPNLMLLCYDWEHAGISVPAIDLQSSGSSARPDLAAYRKTVSSSWNLGMETIHQWEQLGNLFRCINVINWDSDFLCEEWTIAHLKLFSSQLKKTIGQMNI